MEHDLRVITNVDTLLNKKIDTIQEGRELIETINAYMSQLLNEMRDREDITNDISEAYNNVRYDLKKARNNIQQQMMHMVKLRKSTG